MIKIKNYIFNENEINYINQSGEFLYISTKESNLLRPIIATFDDIEWNYDKNNNIHEEYVISQLKEYEEEHKELVETNYNLATKKTELEDRINKAIEYVKEYYPTSTIYYQDEQDKLIKILRGE